MAGNRAVSEYTELIARAFDGAIVVNGQRIVGHSSGLLWARSPNGEDERRRAALAMIDRRALDRDNDWSDV
jgi:hypothetical protein